MRKIQKLIRYTVITIGFIVVMTILGAAVRLVVKSLCYGANEFFQLVNP